MDRQITDMTATRREGGEREYPPVVAELESAGLHSRMKYIMTQKENIAEKVACHPIYGLCVRGRSKAGDKPGDEMVGPGLYK